MTMRLPETGFWALTALAAGRRHGYEIIRATAEATGRSVDLKATTLYAALERLERDGLIAADGDEVVDGRARRYYRITDAGSGRLELEVAALERSLGAARRALRARRPGGATAPASGGAAAGSRPVTA